MRCWSRQGNVHQLGFAALCEAMEQTFEQLPYLLLTLVSTWFNIISAAPVLIKAPEYKNPKI